MASRIVPASGEPVDPTPRASMTAKRKLEVLLAHKGCCAKCGEKITDGEWDANHIIPLFQGGADDNSNLEPLHRRCHRELTDGKHAAENAKLRRLIAKYSTPLSEWPRTQKIPSRKMRRRWGDA